MQELGQIKSYHFNNKIILAIDSRWSDYFNSENPTFKAVIDNGEYVLLGPKVNHTGPSTNSNTKEIDVSE